MACGFVVTGCSTGFGRALARQVLAAGHRAVVTARSADQVKDIVDAYADDALALPLDVIDPAAGAGRGRRRQVRRRGPHRR
ncbi:SDR family NAD(P)-dependent oxidoreductase [Streptomyces sp. NPDC005962]|uniref:SDR family NAD(P)-dependent oxidoreductase n=1 Tax=Streptomyces sp. NPDC005962 TaxID=3154466 RepID=UPI0033E872FE